MYAASLCSRNEPFVFCTIRQNIPKCCRTSHVGWLGTRPNVACLVGDQTTYKMARGRVTHYYNFISILWSKRNLRRFFIQFLLRKLYIKLKQNIKIPYSIIMIHNIGNMKEIPHTNNNESWIVWLFKQIIIINIQFQCPHCIVHACKHYTGLMK